YSEIVSPSFFARRLISLATLLFTLRVITLVLCRTSEPLRFIFSHRNDSPFCTFGVSGLALTGGILMQANVFAV
ncbi:hypothetical protein LNL97_04470, partial (plasmid) [Escherichia coli]|nr:hypothetical protein [Escherichia coli]